MTDLCISLLGAPFKAAAIEQFASTNLIRMDDVPGDAAALTPAVAIDGDRVLVGQPGAGIANGDSGGAAAFLRCGKRAAKDSLRSLEFWSLLVRHFLQRARVQLGHQIDRVACIVPAELDGEAALELHKACLLAGASDSAVVALRGRVTAAQGQPNGILELWDDGLRLTLFGQSLEPRTGSRSDLERPGGRQEGVQRLISTSMQRRGETAPSAVVRKAMVDELFRFWRDSNALEAPIYVEVPSTAGAPAALLATPTLFTKAEAAFQAELRDLLAHAGLGASEPVHLTLTGCWLGAGIRHVRQLLPHASVQQHPNLAFEVGAEALAKMPQRKLGLSCNILTAPLDEHGAPITGHSRTTLIQCGTELPATFETTAFEPASLSGNHAPKVGVLAEPPGRSPRVLLALEPKQVPQLAGALLRVTVHAETSKMLLIEVTYRNSMSRKIGLVNKATGKWDEFSPDGYARIRNLE